MGWYWYGTRGGKPSYADTRGLSTVIHAYTMSTSLLQLPYRLNRLRLLFGTYISRAKSHIIPVRFGMVCPPFIPYQYHTKGPMGWDILPTFYLLTSSKKNKTISESMIRRKKKKKDRKEKTFLSYGKVNTSSIPIYIHTSIQCVVPNRLPNRQKEKEKEGKAAEEKRERKEKKGKERKRKGTEKKERKRKKGRGK